MRTVSYRLVDLQKATIPIGFEGENDYTRVILDCKKMFDEEPTYVPALSITAPTGEKYPGIVTREGNNVYWDVSAADLPAEGYGEIQLAFVKGTQVGKTWVAKTHVNRSIIPSGTTPTALANFIIEASEIVNGIPQAIQDALAEAKASGEFDGADGFSPTVEVTEITGGHRLKITDAEGPETVDVMDGQDGAPGQDGQPGRDGVDGKDGKDGADGQDGYSPTATVTKSGKVATITITDKNGTTTETVSDGADADPTTLIDDTAGDGTTNKTWSADKLLN